MYNTFGIHLTDRTLPSTEIAIPSVRKKLVSDNRPNPKLKKATKSYRELLAASDHVRRFNQQLSKLHADEEEARRRNVSIKRPFKRSEIKNRFVGTPEHRICLDEKGDISLYRLTQNAFDNDYYVNLLKLPPPSPVLHVSNEMEPLSPINRHENALPPTRAPLIKTDDLNRLAPKLETLISNANKSFYCTIHHSVTCVCHARTDPREDIGNIHDITFASTKYLENMWWNEKRARAVDDILMKTDHTRSLQ